MITGHPQGVIFLRRMISYGSLLTSTSAKVTGERSLGSLKIGQVSGHEFNKFNKNNSWSEFNEI